MILDTLENAGRYERLNPLFAAAFRWLRQADPSQLAPGRIEVDGERLFIVVDHKDGRGRAGAKLAGRNTAVVENPARSAPGRTARG